jgi:hypothetical protein
VPSTSSGGTPISLPHITTSPATNHASLGVAGYPAAHNSMPSLPRDNPAAVDGAPQELLASDSSHITPLSVSGTPQNPAPSAHPKFSKTAGTSSRKKQFTTLNTYKYHACGDYPNTIRRYGTTDSYSTEIVSYSLSCILSSLHFTFRVSLNTRRPRLGTSGQIESFSLSRSQLSNAVKLVYYASASSVQVAAPSQFQGHHRDITMLRLLKTIGIILVLFSLGTKVTQRLV